MRKTRHVVAACLGLCTLIAGGSGASATVVRMQGNGCKVMNSSGTTYNPTVSGMAVVNNSTSQLYSVCTLPVDDWGQTYGYAYVQGRVGAYCGTINSYIIIPIETYSYTTRYADFCTQCATNNLWTCYWSVPFPGTWYKAYTIVSSLGRSFQHLYVQVSD